MEETSRSHSYVCVKKEHAGVIREKLKEIREKFSVSLREVPPPKAKTDCGSGPLGLSVLFFTVEKSGDASQIEVSQTAVRVQGFVDALCAGLSDHGDDSSYDSDQDGEGDADDKHQDVSRTASETLAAEYADYVTQGDAAVSRLEFGLRLGYTEPLVRAALRRLGASPAQNELLAELIRQASKASAAAAASARAAGGAPVGHPVEDDAPALSLAAAQPRPRLRPIVVDGSNVAMSHGNKEVFSCRGLRLCVDWFRARGHTDITVFVPKWRKEAARPDNLVTEQAILGELERERLLVYTPSRLVGGKRLVCYDDRYILRLAADTGGVVVSNDNYRDLAQENADFRRVVEERILMYSFVNDRFMPPDDPLGRTGPSLDQFLRLAAVRADQPPPCPYAKKCTYGNKCKFSHPERGLLPHKSVTERLAEQAQKQLLAAGLVRGGPGKQLKGKSLSLPLDSGGLAGPAGPAVRKSPLTRSQSSVPSKALGASSANVGVLGAPLRHQHSQAMLSKSFSVDSMLGPAAAAMFPGPAGPAGPAGSAPGSAGPGAGPGPGGGGCAADDGGAAGANLHRPLQRQLSLNPTFDARLLQMRRAIGLGASASPSASDPLAATLAQPLGPLGHLGSHGPHLAVSRIASAPDSYRPWTPQQQQQQQQQQRLLGAKAPCGSEPQLSSPYEWNQAHQALLTAQAAAQAQAQQHVRHRMHYHLASIFPEELVATAMGLYPDEVDPQKICAAILGLQNEVKSS